MATFHSFALVALLSVAGSVAAASGDNDAEPSRAAHQHSAPKATKTAQSTTHHASHGKTRAEVLKELEESRKNPHLTADGFCSYTGEDSGRYVGPNGKC